MCGVVEVLLLFVVVSCGVCRVVGENSCGVLGCVDHLPAGPSFRRSAQNFALFFTPFSFVFSLSVRGIWVVFEVLEPSNVHILEPRRTGQEPKRAHLRVPAFKNTTKT